MSMGDFVRDVFLEQVSLTASGFTSGQPSHEAFMASTLLSCRTLFFSGPLAVCFTQQKRQRCMELTLFLFLCAGPAHF